MPSHHQHVSRRRFLSQTATAAATIAVAPTIVPGSVLGAEGATPPSETVRLGMIGTGRQCYLKNIPLFQRQADTRIVAACDVDSWRMDQACKKIDNYNQSKHGTKTGAAKYVDYQDLLARDDIDAVVISTPDHWHAPMALDAMKAGKDVSVEKPISRTIGEGKRLAAASQEYSRIFRVDSGYRCEKPVRRAFSLARSGMLGKIHKVYACVPQTDIPCPMPPEMPVPAELDYTRWLGPAPEAPYTLNRVHPVKGWSRPGWMRRLDYCDGMITNWGTHMVNGALWCLGLDRSWPEEIEGTGTYPGRDSFWNVLLKFAITYRYPGVELIYQTEKPYIRLEGDKGWVVAGIGGYFKASSDELLSAKFELVDNPEPHQTSDKRDFIDSVKSRQPTLEPAEVGHHVTSTCLMGHIAVNLGEKLRWDAKAERFVDNEKANAMIDTPITEPTYHG